MAKLAQNSLVREAHRVKHVSSMLLLAVTPAANVLLNLNACSVLFYFLHISESILRRLKHAQAF